MLTYLKERIENFNDFLNAPQGKNLVNSRIKVTNDIALKFPQSKIQNLDIKEYVLGLNKPNTFCYCLEYDTGSTSSIKGSRAKKFGIYYSDSEKKYIINNKYINKYNNSVDTVFAQIKNDICLLIDLSKKPNLTQKQKQQFEDIPLDTMVKSKILSVYNIKDRLAVNSKQHLKTFLDWFGVKLKTDLSFLDLQQRLIEEKNHDPIMREWSLVQFSTFLYNIKDTLQDEAEEQSDFEAKQQVETFLDKDLGNVDNIGEKINKTRKNGVTVYRRDPKVSAKAIQNANGKCELDALHKSFDRKNGTIYLESHHFIPMKYCGECYDKFKRNIDITTNIVALCSNCHNEIHYGKNNARLIKALYAQRQSALQAVGIDINLTDLLKMYN